MRNNMIVCVTYCNLYITYIHICFTHCISVSISIYQYSNYSDIMMFFLQEDSITTIICLLGLGGLALCLGG